MNTSDDEIVFEPFEDGMRPVHKNQTCHNVIHVDTAVDSETNLVHGTCESCGKEFGIAPERFYENGITIGGK